ncbi:MAG: vWA domain-containing protein [Actinomycetota bacterium]
MRLRTLITALLALTLVAAACADGAEDTSSTGGEPSASTTPPTGGEDGGGRGWIDGSPADATGTRDGGRGLAEGGIEMATDAVDDEAPAAVAVDEAADRGDDDAAIEPAEPQLGTPRAGSIDDNEAWADYLAWRATLTDAGVAHRSLEVADRTVIVVRDAEGAPLVDVPVDIFEGGSPVTTLRTRAGGRLLVHASAWGIDGEELRLRVTPPQGEPVEAVVPVGGTAEVVADGAGTPEVVDLHVVLDVTGSMSDEIAQLRDAVDSIAVGVDALPGRPSLRLGMTVYRDEGDDFVTRTFDLTDDIDSFRAALDDVRADGGGDNPEALDEALAEALSAPAWTTDVGALRLVVVIADAPPQVGRQLGQPYTDSLLLAGEMGVKVHAIAASGTDDEAEYAFREMAAVTDGRFVFLSYASGGTATGDSSDVEDRDWEELPLDGLVVRLIAEDLAASGSGTGQQSPAPTTTSTTEAVEGQG